MKAITCFNEVKDDKGKHGPWNIVTMTNYLTMVQRNIFICTKLHTRASVKKSQCATHTQDQQSLCRYKNKTSDCSHQSDSQCLVSRFRQIKVCYKLHKFNLKTIHNFFNLITSGNTWNVHKANRQPPVSQFTLLKPYANILYYNHSPV